MNQEENNGVWGQIKKGLRAIVPPASAISSPDHLITEVNWIGILGCAFVTCILVGVLCGISGSILTCLVDWDHIWVWVLLTTPPLSLTASPGRPFHTVPSFLGEAELWTRCYTTLARRLLTNIADRMDGDHWLDALESHALVWETPLQEVSII